MLAAADVPLGNPSALLAQGKHKADYDPILWPSGVMNLQVSALFLCATRRHSVAAWRCMGPAKLVRNAPPNPQGSALRGVWGAAPRTGVAQFQRIAWLRTQGYLSTSISYLSTELYQESGTATHGSG